ncbi:MAG: DUF3224 domain-containing protein [Acidobacteriota bacterium]
MTSDHLPTRVSPLDRRSIALSIVLHLAIFLITGFSLFLLSLSILPNSVGADTMSPPTTATGTFEVQITPESRSEEDGIAQGRMSLSKTFQGDLEGTGAGEMLTGHGQVPTSAAYVAVERVTGSLHGKSGSFLLVHRGVMTAEEQNAHITIVPDSGTGELEGISGTFVIDNSEGGHRYTLEYELP